MLKDKETILHSCFHPRVIKQPYTGDYIKVSCGCCYGCLLERKNKMSFLCSQHEQDYKYTVFLTLTFAPEFMPICEPRYNEDKSQVHLYNVPTKLRNNEDYIGSFSTLDYSLNKFNNVLRKTNLGGFIGYTSACDCQNFLKRLRSKMLYSYGCNEKISYYSVSEYGLKTFRPHWHLLLYFNEQKTLEAFRKSIHSCWKYGRINWSLSNGKTASYVASYVNSYTSLPLFYSFSELRPRCLHSAYFGLQYYKTEKKKIYQDVSNGVIEFSRQIGSKYVSFHLTSQVESFLFPKTFNFSRSSLDTLYYNYTIYRESQKFYQGTPAEIAREITKDLYNKEYLSSPFYRPEHINFLEYISSLNTHIFNDYTNYGIPNTEFVDREIDEVVKFQSFVYRLLLQSKHFLDLAQDFTTPFKLFRLIVNYYKQKDYNSLKKFYEYQERLFKDKLDVVTLLHLYDNIPFNLKGEFHDLYHKFELLLSPLTDDWQILLHKYNVELNRIKHYNKLPDYIAYKANTIQQINRSIKHKALNDLNKIFL